MSNKSPLKSTKLYLVLSVLSITISDSDKTCKANDYMVKVSKIILVFYIFHFCKISLQIKINFKVNQLRSKISNQHLRYCLVTNNVCDIMRKKASCQTIYQSSTTQFLFISNTYVVRVLVILEFQVKGRYVQFKRSLINVHCRK